jgi:hypothetical protein
MNTIHTILERIRRIRQQRAELLVYAERVEAIEQAEPFDHPYWQGVTDEEGWLQDDLSHNLDHLMGDARAMTKPAAWQLAHEMNDAHDFIRGADTRTFIWRSNDFNDEVTRKIVWISDGDNLIIIEGKQIWVDDDIDDIIDEWQVRVRYVADYFCK